jgi:hypothetical protein
MTDCAFEKNFLKTMIRDFKQLLLFNPPGKFGGELHSQEVYQGSAQGSENVTLSKLGTMMLYYYLVYKEPCPESPTPEQQAKINEVWIAMNMPENVVPL